MEAHYWQYFGLTQSPFQHHSEDVPYFSIQAWEQRIALLIHLAECSQVLLVMVGEAGCGKTTFKQHLLKTIKASDLLSTHQMAAHDQLTPNNLWEELGRHISLPEVEWKIADLAAQVDSVVEQLNHFTKPHLLVIDDAHLLPAKTLAMLLQLNTKQTDQHYNLRVLLIGSPELSDRLTELSQQEQMGENAIHTLIFDRFTLAETKRYLEFCFSHVGHNQTLPIPDPQVAQIYRQSQGNPQKIIYLTEEWMSQVSQQHNALVAKKSGFSKRYIILLSTVFLVVAMLFIKPINFRKIHGLASTITTTPETVIADAKKTVAMPLPEENSQKIPNSVMIEEQTKILKSLPPQPIKHKILALQDLEKLVSAASATNMSPESPPQAARSERTAPAKMSEQVPTQTKLTRAQAEAILAQINQDAGLDEDFAVDDNEDNTKNSDKITAEPMPKSSIASSEPPQSVVMLKRSYKATKKLKNTVQATTSSSSDKYTLQLISLTQASAAEHFIQQYHLKNAHVVNTHVHNKNRYVVLIGHYPTRAAAEKAIKQLPKTIQALHPWIRSTQSVQYATVTKPEQVATTQMVETQSLF